VDSNTILEVLTSGSTIIVPESRAPEHIIETIKKYQVSVLPARPTFLNLLLLALGQNTDDLASLRLITYGT
jgi:non-ribosomal peptide synthetase component E (peptide arylation enzyme)